MQSDGLKPDREEAVAKPPKGQVLDVEPLFSNTSEIRLVFRDKEYRLRMTKSGKLLLMK